MENNPSVRRPSVPVVVASIILLDIAVGLLVPALYQATLIFGTIAFFSAMVFGASFRANNRKGCMLIAGIVGIACAIMFNEWFYQSLLFNQKDDFIRFGGTFGTIIGGFVGIALKR